MKKTISRSRTVNNQKKEIKPSLVTRQHLHIPKYVFPVALLLLLILVISRLVIPKNNTAQADEKLVQTQAKTTEVNRDFEFPLKNDQNKELGKIKYSIQTAELRKDIVVNGQTAKAVPGRAFLILTIKLSNDLNRSVDMNTRDYVRLATAGKEDEWLAPEIHNDPVEIQAISVKYTRLGFAVDDNDKGFILQVGDINQNKDKIELKF
jgi:hypothetical protein